MLGAREAQDLVARFPENDLQVYVVWESVLGGDHDRAEAATVSINGPNVTHYWDADAASGQWFAENMPWTSGRGPAWDVFYLFDADATWTDAPNPVTSWGYTIVGELNSLENGLNQLLAGT